MELIILVVGEKEEGKEEKRENRRNRKTRPKIRICDDINPHIMRGGEERTHETHKKIEREKPKERETKGEREREREN